MAVDSARHLVAVGSGGTTATGRSSGAGACPGFVTLIDSGTNSVIKVIKLSGQGGYLTVDTATHRIYAANADVNSVTVIDEASKSITAMIRVSSPDVLVADATRGQVYVGTGSTLAIIDEASNRVVGSVTGVDGPGQFALDPARQLAYVDDRDAMQNLSTVDVVDLTDDTVSAVVPLGDRVALGVAVDTSTHAAYVGYTNWAHTMRLDVITQAVRTNVVLISPASGPASGGQTVTIYGEHFTGATRVVFGNAAAASFHVDSDTQITAVTPAYAVGKAFVRVRTTAGGPCLREALAPSSRSSGESDTSGVAMYRRG